MKDLSFLRGDGGKNQKLRGKSDFCPPGLIFLISATVSNGSLSQPIKIKDSFLLSQKFTKKTLVC